MKSKAEFAACACPAQLLDAPPNKSPPDNPLSTSAAGSVELVCAEPSEPAPMATQGVVWACVGMLELTDMPPNRSVVALVAEGCPAPRLPIRSFAGNVLGCDELL